MITNCADSVDESPALSVFADLFVVVEEEFESHSINDDLLSGISSEVAEKLRWVTL